MMPTAYAFEPATEHIYIGHPEHPDRLRKLDPFLHSIGAAEIQVRPALRDEISLVHSQALMDAIVDACREDDAIIDFAPTYVTRASFECALRAAGGTIDCMRHVLAGDVSNAFSIVRPPGHHAEPDRAMGFCLFNNVAIAAACALETGLQRVAIVDYDAHHGNGTQAAFLDDPRVAYLSTHQWGIYPGTGWFEEAPHARRRIVNVPLPAGSGDLAYARIADEIIAPFIRGFNPDMILVSAGFDAHWKDPLTSLGLSTAGYRMLSEALVGLAEVHCQGRIVFVLEGGYDPDNVANGVAAVFGALMHRDFGDPHDASLRKEPDVDSRLAAIKTWNAF